MKIDYQRLLGRENAKDNPDDMAILYYKYKLGIMPIQTTEVCVVFGGQKRLQRHRVEVKELPCESFEEYLKILEEMQLLPKSVVGFCNNEAN